MKYTLALFVFFLSCKTAKIINHPLIREDGFYYRKKSIDLWQFIRFYGDGHVTINEVLSKDDYFSKYQNKLMCCVDSTQAAFKKFSSLKIQKFSTIKDSIFFKIPPNSESGPYITAFRCKLHADSITAEMHALEVDTSRVKMQTTVDVTFKFVKAACDLKLTIPKRTDWNVGKNRMFKMD